MRCNFCTQLRFLACLGGCKNTWLQTTDLIDFSCTCRTTGSQVTTSSNAVSPDNNLTHLDTTSRDGSLSIIDPTTTFTSIKLTTLLTAVITSDDEVTISVTSQHSFTVHDNRVLAYSIVAVSIVLVSAQGCRE